MAYYLEEEEKKIPLPIAIIAIIAVVFGLVSFMKPKTSQIVQQNENATVEMSIIGNIRENSATVYWRTSQDTTGKIIYGTDPNSLNLVAYDVRETASFSQPRNNHLVTLSNLEPSTTYYFMFEQGDARIGQTSDIPFQLATISRFTDPYDHEPIFGSIVDALGNISEDAIVLVRIKDAFPLIQHTKVDGSFLVSLCCVIDSSTGEPMYPGDETQMAIEVVSEAGSTKKISGTLAEVSLAVGSLALDNTEIDLFAQGIKPRKSNTEKKVAGASDPLILTLDDDVQYEDIDIIYPKSDASIAGSRPIIKGFGIPGKVVKGEISPTGKIFRTTVNDSKIWEYDPTFELPSGSYELIISTENAQNTLVRKTRSFRVLKSGESVLGSATDSATITPQPTDIVATNSPIPTEDITPTGGATRIPTPPVTGSNILPFALMSAVLIIIGVGIVLIF